MWVSNITNLFIPGTPCRLVEFCGTVVMVCSICFHNESETMLNSKSNPIKSRQNTNEDHRHFHSSHSRRSQWSSTIINSEWFDLVWFLSTTGKSWSLSIYKVFLQLFVYKSYWKSRAILMEAIPNMLLILLSHTFDSFIFNTFIPLTVYLSRSRKCWPFWPRPLWSERSTVSNNQ